MVVRNLTISATFERGEAVGDFGGVGGARLGVFGEQLLDEVAQLARDVGVQVAGSGGSCPISAQQRTAQRRDFALSLRVISP